MFKWKNFNEKLAVKLKSMFKPLIACLFKVVDQRSQLLTVPVMFLVQWSVWDFWDFMHIVSFLIWKTVCEKSL